jgi:hypothetical protein
MNKEYYTVISVDEETNVILRKYNPKFLTASIKFFLDRFKRIDEFTIPVVIRKKHTFKSKRVLVDKELFKKLKTVGVENKVSLTILIRASVIIYDNFINE